MTESLNTPTKQKPLPNIITTEKLKFTIPSQPLSNLRPFLLQQYAQSTADLQIYDAAILKKIQSMQSKLKKIDVVVSLI